MHKKAKLFWEVVDVHSNESSGFRGPLPYLRCRELIKRYFSGPPHKLLKKNLHYHERQSTTEMPQQKDTKVDNERWFKRTCKQIVQLNFSLGDLQQRYNKTKKDNHWSRRYSLLLRIFFLLLMECATCTTTTLIRKQRLLLNYDKNCLEKLCTLYLMNPQKIY